MIKYENVPYRRWSSRRLRGLTYLTETKQHRRLMMHIGKAMRAGKAVTYDHRIVNPKAIPGEPYDVISATIGE